MKAPRRWPKSVDSKSASVSWGPAAAEVFGWALDEALGRRVELLVPAERLDEERAIAERVAREGRFPRTETVRRARDGRLVPVALSAVALRDEAGTFIGRSCAFEDLSALHQLRGRLPAQEQFLAHVTREAADAILGVGRDGRVTGFNRAAEGLLALGAGEVLGRPLAEVAGDPGATALLARVEAAPLAAAAGELPGHPEDPAVGPAHLHLAVDERHPDAKRGDGVAERVEILRACDARGGGVTPRLCG